LHKLDVQEGIEAVFVVVFAFALRETRFASLI
jgi:hypothetical protein